VEWAISRRFWTPLELSFLQLLEDLPHDPEACRADWAATLRDQARAAFREVVAMLEAAPRNLKSTVVANDYLETAIRSVLNGNIIIVTADSL